MKDIRPKYSNTIYLVLNDGETFDCLPGCTIQVFSQDDQERLEQGEKAYDLKPEYVFDCWDIFQSWLSQEDIGD